MKKWKVGFFVSLVLLVASNVAWAFLAIDQTLSLTYLEASLESVSRANDDLGRLVVQGAHGYTKKDVLHLLRQAKPKAFIVDEGDVVWFEGIAFRFSDDKLVAVGG